MKLMHHVNWFLISYCQQFHLAESLSHQGRIKPPENYTNTPHLPFFFFWGKLQVYIQDKKTLQPHLALDFLVCVVFLPKRRTPASCKRCLCIFLDCVLWNRAVIPAFYNTWQQTHIPCASQASPKAIKCVGYGQHRVRASNYQPQSPHTLCAWELQIPW